MLKITNFWSESQNFYEILIFNVNSLLPIIASLCTILQNSVPIDNPALDEIDEGE